MYTAWDRLDTGLGLIMQELESAAVLNDTLVIFFSDNGPPFPSAKTNLFEQGQGDPLIISTPAQRASASRGVTKSEGDNEGEARGVRRSEAVVSALDFLPTILDWTGVAYPEGATAGVKPAHLTGASLLPLLKDKTSARTPKDTWRNTAYGSHQFHSLYAYYPMRSMVNDRYRLVHNLSPNLHYAILEDVEGTQTWQDIARLGEAGEPTGWALDFHTYMQRPEWQLYDVQRDPINLVNLAANESHAATLHAMQEELWAWRRDTEDPWLVCNPDGSASHDSKCSL